MTEQEQKAVYILTHATSEIKVALNTYLILSMRSGVNGPDVGQAFLDLQAAVNSADALAGELRLEMVTTHEQA